MKAGLKGLTVLWASLLLIGYGCGDGSEPESAAGNDYGQAASPIILPMVFDSVAAGAFHTCAISGGNLYCWGAGLSGQLGNGANSSTNYRVQESTHASNWASVTAGWDYSCAIKTDGSLYCWGYNSEGQLGTGDSVSRNIPTREASSAGDWASVSAGGYHTCAKKTNGAIWCWGGNDHDQLGTNDASYRQKSPVQVGTATTWKSLSNGMWHSCAIKKDGTLWCWGYGWYGQLGYGSILDKAKPFKVNAATNWALVASGRQHTCAKKKDGSLWCWGDNVTYGQLGIGKKGGQKTRPVKVVTAITDWNALSLGQYFSCAKRKSGAIYCWGSNGSGQMGLGTEASPKTKPIKSLGSGIILTTGGSHTCALKSDQTLWCWGSNASGQLGNNSLDTHSSYPVQVN